MDIQKYSSHLNNANRAKLIAPSIFSARELVWENIVIILHRSGKDPPTPTPMKKNPHIYGYTCYFLKAHPAKMVVVWYYSPIIMHHSLSILCVFKSNIRVVCIHCTLPKSPYLLPYLHRYMRLFYLDIYNWIHLSIILYELLYSKYIFIFSELIPVGMLEFWLQTYKI